MAVAEQNLILNLPFDEAAGAKIAYDYAQNRHDATISGGADFVGGKQGNCINFEGTGKATIEANLLTLSGNFTILAWVKENTYPDGYSGQQIGLLCNTAVLDGSKDLWVNVQPDSWGFFVIRKAGNTITLMLDMQTVGKVTLSSTMTGIALVQDVYGTEYAYADLDEVKFYNTVLTNEEIEQELNSVSQLEYYINGTNLRDFGIRVESSTGVLDLPKMKTPTSNDWADYHGKVIDLSDKRFEEREISLSCWLKASGKMDFVERVNKLYEVFREDGTQRLMISIHPTKPLVYEVYCEDGVAPSKRWHDDKMIGTFTLKVKEPDPVKRVIRHQKLGGSTQNLTIAFKSDKMVNVYWGDGSVDYDVYGDHTGDNALTHTYADNGIYYAIVGGVIEEIEDFNTSGILVWSRL